MREPLDLIIADGELVLDDRTMKGDLAIQGEKIWAIGRAEGFPPAKRRIDASGKIVLPGAIDPHTHFEMTLREKTTPHDWHEETMAAAFGGVTTVIDFAWQGVDFEAHNSLDLGEVVRAKVERMGKISAVDFSFHGVFTDTSDLDRVLAGVRETVAYGITSFKIFMGQSSRKFVRSDKRSWWVDDWGLYNVLQAAREAGAVVGVHAENSTIGDALMVKFAAEETRGGRLQAAHIARAKANFTEEEAIQRAITLARATGARLYITHISTREGVHLVRAARSAGQAVFAEGCPQYFLFGEDFLEGPDGLLAVFSPPLRRKSDQEALWKGLQDGAISFTGTDHLSWNRDQKVAGIKTYMEARGGHVGVELRLPILYSEGVRRGRISLPRLAKVCSTNAAKVFGFYPRKGTLTPGADADLVVLDPRIEWTVRSENLHLKTDWTMYDGLKVTGLPVLTVLRGQIIVEGDRYLGKAGDGEFLKGKIEEEIIRTA